ncbi:hypothetical protein [Sphingomonas fuzhouensis]|uniref:hypothetical protein n=1 Tax=Sphingomonas fuzhouensis TaxID=3106033 RepID=UPI002AFEF1D1|nr:hypothetical protein [Sphingomonas sp. SGZ-02]
MLTQLRDHHAAVVRWLDAHRNLCDAARPDYQALRHVRWQSAQASRKRMLFLAEVVFPFAERHAGLKAAAGLLTLRNETPGYGQILSAFIARWPMDVVIADTDGYARAADAYRREADKRLLAEERHLRTLIAEVEWRAGDAPVSTGPSASSPHPAPVRPQS